MELSGFKSFADRQTIEYGDGITAIVGPNGCGKSNVADAIRWVLGEKSAKSLRGETMTDVIFGGTDMRKSLGYCEVTLYFDNSDRAMSRLSFDEVSFTRKLYRSGESEYFINKQQCLQRDIINHLREGGVAKEGYTIIGQGKIAEILNSKPENRRAIFEEATGIMDFKKRKIEAENSLDRTRENYTRIADKLKTLEDTLIPLEKQAEKTLKSREYKKELKLHEINVFVAQQENSVNEKKKITDKITGLDEQTNLRKQDLDKAIVEYDKIFEQIDVAEKLLNEMREKHADMRVEMENKSGQLQLFKERVKGLESTLNSLKKEIAQNLADVAEKQKTKNLNVGKIGELTKAQNGLNEEHKQILAELTKLNELLAFGEKQTEQQRKQMLSSMQSLSDINLDKGTLSNQLENLNQKLVELKEKLVAVETKGKQAMDTLCEYADAYEKKTQSIKDVESSIVEQEKEIKAKNDIISEYENKILRVRTEIGVTENKVKWYKDIASSYSGYGDAVKRLMNGAKNNRFLSDKIRGTVAEILKFDNKHVYAIQTALGGAEQNVITEDTADAKELIRFLKKNNIGRIKFLPLDSVKRHENGSVISSAIDEKGVVGFATDLVEYDRYYENVIYYLFGNTLVVDDIDNATAIANKYSFAFRIVTLDGDLLSTQGTMSGGAKQLNQASGILTNDKTLNDLENQLSLLKKEFERLNKVCTDVQNEQDENTDKYNESKEKIGVIKQEIASLREKQLSTERLLGEAKTEKDQIENQIKSTNENVEVIKLEYARITSGTEELEKMKLSASSEVEKTEEEYDKMTEKRNQLITSSTELQVKITAVNSEIAQLKADNLRLEQEAELLLGTNVEKEKQKTDIEEQIEKVRRSEDVFMLSQEDRKVLEEMQEKIAKEQAKYEKTKARLAVLDKEKVVLTEQLTELATKRHNQEIALTKLESDLEFAAKAISENYGETFETAQKYKLDDYDAKEGKALVTKLKRDISLLGPINENAVEDSQALRAEYDEQLVQKQDVEKAENELRNNIATIKAQMLEKFNDGFEKINQNYMRIFKDLFGGGRALLELDYSQAEDELEAGVEIIAEPPGKKQKLSLLSGGEQTLTAIAILFAILRLKPMPFCVLDEIEAALDDTNVVRFTDYLQKFAKETQFIVITHKKQTMESANSLFGVTMQEKGVTKTVSVKFTDIKIEKDEAVFKSGVV